MASRRMLSFKIINSARFLKMPPSTQNLYFHLNIRADDDGIVEGFSTMRMVGATEDDLKILAGKEFVHILNEDLVTYIRDWKEHNLIRADRKVDSIYKDLLLQILPEVKLLESRERTDRKHGTPKGQPKGQPKGRIGKVRVGKVRVGKVRVGKVSKDNNNKKHKYGEYKNILLTDEERDRLIQDYTEPIFNKGIEFFSAYKLEKGTKTKSDNLTIRRWVIKAVTEKKIKEPEVFNFGGFNE